MNNNKKTRGGDADGNITHTPLLTSLHLCANKEKMISWCFPVLSFIWNLGIKKMY